MARPRLESLKVESARDRMLDLNPDIEVEIYNEPYTSENALRIAKDYDILLDGTDNFPTRYLTNDVAGVSWQAKCVRFHFIRFDGQVSVFYAKEGPCYRCLFPEPPAARTCPFVRGRRRAGRAARHDWNDPSH